MAMSAAERKAAQRAREAQNGIEKVEIHLSSSEMETLQHNCALRRPGREPYSADEYIATLIHRDDAVLREQMAAMGDRICPKRGVSLPVGRLLS